MKATIKSTKWYGRFWPPERRKIKVLQMMVDHMTPSIEQKVNKAMRDSLLYGTPLPTTPEEDKG